VIDDKKKKIKSMIESLINDDKLEDAKLAIEDYKKVVPDDIDIYSMLGVINILGNNLDDAKEILLEGLVKDYLNFDINYNLAYLAELEQNYKNAFYFYNKALQNCKNDDLKEQINEKINNLLCDYEELKTYNRERLSIFLHKRIG